MPRNLLNYQRSHAAWKLDTVVKHLPAAYQAFYKEWKVDQPEPVHYKPEPGRWKKDPKTGEIRPVQTVPIPLRHPPELHHGLWGGEAVIKGFQHRGRNASLIPHWWVPSLHRTVLYSEVLDRWMELVVTQRAVQLVHDHHGLDMYLLKSRACDIASLLGLRIKREILLALSSGSLWPEDAARRQELLTKYSEFIVPEDQVEWYGLTVGEAIRKQHEDRSAAGPPPPLKLQYRAELVEKLKHLRDNPETASPPESDSWLSKMNPFASRTVEKT